MERKVDEFLNIEKGVELDMKMNESIANLYRDLLFDSQKMKEGDLKLVSESVNWLNKNDVFSTNSRFEEGFTFNARETQPSSSPSSPSVFKCLTWDGGYMVDGRDAGVAFIDGDDCLFPSGENHSPFRGPVTKMLFKKNHPDVDLKTVYGGKYKGVEIELGGKKVSLDEKTNYYLSKSVEDLFTIAKRRIGDLDSPRLDAVSTVVDDFSSSLDGIGRIVESAKARDRLSLFKQGLDGVAEGQKSFGNILLGDSNYSLLYLDAIGNLGGQHDGYFSLVDDAGEPSFYVQFLTDEEGHLSLKKNSLQFYDASGISVPFGASDYNKVRDNVVDFRES